MSEKEKMLKGMIYDSSDSELIKLRCEVRDLLTLFNSTKESDFETKNSLFKKIIPNQKENCYVQGPLYVDYGCNVYLGKNFYANFNFTALDCSPIIIGDNVFFGPNCQLVTPMHSLLASEREQYLKEDGLTYSDKEYSKKITIEDNCWICAGVIVIGGVKISHDCVIGAGSVVTKNIPANSLVVGNPARVIRTITEKDSIYLKKELF